MININEILKLSSSERILLIEKIWDSLNTKELSLAEEHKRELDKRILRMQNGQTKFFSWEEVKSGLKDFPKLLCLF